MSKKASGIDVTKPPEPENVSDLPEPENVSDLPAHYVREDFHRMLEGQVMSQKKGDIIKEQQKLHFFLSTNAPIALFDESMLAKCPCKCAHVFAWDGGVKKEAEE